MLREELIDKIAELYIGYSDDDGQWNTDILDAVMSLLIAESAASSPVRLAQCGYVPCGTWFPMQIYDCCPYHDSHPCPECGNRNEDCTCDNCSQCGCYDCECPRCTRCGEIPGECPCPEEEVVFA
jgi:hypothetical protein